MHKKINFKSESGFTLMELMVVIGVLAILIAILLPQFTGYTAQAQAISAASEMKNALTAGYSYYTSVTARGSATATAAFDAGIAQQRMLKASNPNATITVNSADDVDFSVEKGGITFSTQLDLTTGKLGTDGADGAMLCAGSNNQVCTDLQNEGALQVQ